MTQQTATMTLTATLKDYIVRRADAQRKAKRARRTVRTPADVRATLLKEIGLEDDQAAVQRFILRNRRWLTIAHLLYGERRGRPHPVREPERFEEDKALFFSSELGM